MLNLNDCAEGDEAELREIARAHRPDRLLLTQFSYAAWKGGRANAHFRELAARRKLETIAAQIHALKPRHVVPFASFVYFSNEENSYLNDHINRPADAAAAIAQAGAEPADPVSRRHAGIAGTPHDNARGARAPSTQSMTSCRPAACGRRARACRCERLEQRIRRLSRAGLPAEFASADQTAAPLPAPRRLPSGDHPPHRSRHDGQRLDRRRLRRYAGRQAKTSRCTRARSRSCSTIRSASIR